MSDVKIMSPEELATAPFIICALAADPGHFTAAAKPRAWRTA